MILSPLLASVPNIIHIFGTLKDDQPRRGVEGEAPSGFAGGGGDASPYNDKDLPENLVTARQVHGTEIYFAREAGPPAQGGFDILFSTRQGIAVGVKTADCLPILIVEPEIGVVAAAHAGWRGTLREIAAKAVTRIIELGGRPDRVRAALGPAIGPCCYEVGEDLYDSFQKNFPDPGRVFQKTGKKWLLDLAEANRISLVRKGVRAERIDRIDLCTRCRPDLFHSWRRDGERAGRMVSFIQLH